MLTRRKRVSLMPFEELSEQKRATNGQHVARPQDNTRGQHVGSRQASGPHWLCLLLLVPQMPTVVLPTLPSCCNRGSAGCEAKIHHASLQRNHNTLGRLRVDNGLTSHEYLHLTASPSCTLSSSATYPKAYARENKAPARSHKTTWTHFGQTFADS